MNKQERLNQLADQEKFYKVLEGYFDAGWRAWVKGIQAENQVSNLRMFRILEQLNGIDFVNDLISFMRSTKNKFSLLKLTRKPKGIELNDNRYPSIPKLMVYKNPSGSYRDGEVYIQITRDRWVYFTF